MYTKQHKTAKVSPVTTDTPVTNQFAPRPFVVQPQTEDVKPSQNQTTNLQAKSEQIGNGFPDPAVFTRHVAPPKQPRIQMKLITQPKGKYEQETDVLQQNGESQIINRDVDSAKVASGATRINKQDIDLEQIGHGMIYQDQLNESQSKWLQNHGYQAQWFPGGQVVDAGSGLHYGLLLPTPEGQAAGHEPILAFRGTSDLATAWQDLDINSPGHGGIQQILKGFATAYVQGIVSQYGRLVVTGHSLGGALAQHFTGTHPDLVKRLVTFQSAAPNGGQYKKNIAALDKKDRPEVVHHIAKGDIVDLIGGEHLEGKFFEHDLEASGMASVSTLARIKQAHTSQLLNTEDIVGANQTLASGEKASGKHQEPIKEYQGSRPYGVKSRLAEFGRMTALNKVTAVPGGLIAGGAGLALTVPEVILRGAGKGLVAGGKAIGRGASSLVNSARNLFKSKKEKND
jgi:hypothetical protein